MAPRRKDIEHVSASADGTTYHVGSGDLGDMSLVPEKKLRPPSQLAKSGELFKAEHPPDPRPQKLQVLEPVDETRDELPEDYQVITSGNLTKVGGESVKHEELPKAQENKKEEAQQPPLF
jgi:hypothetical protein